MSPVALIGLTGGMGAGKSTALAALRDLGAEVLSTDEVVHQLYRDPDVVKAVTARLGEGVAPGGEIDRAAVASAVFAEETQREWLEQLLWPLVGQRIASWIERVRATAPPPRVAVLEVPLLFESGFDEGCDATIAIVADEQTIGQRTAGRGLIGVSERSSRQLSQQEKAARASFVVKNDGNPEELRQKLSSLLDNLG